MFNRLITITLFFSFGLTTLSAVSVANEIAQGKKYFPQLVQMHGGKYVSDPQVENYVNRVGQKLAAHTKREQFSYEFVVVNDSAPNAFTLPGGKIMISRGLLELLDSESELAAVLGHEIVHAAAGHAAKAQERAQTWNSVAKGLSYAGVGGLLAGVATAAIAGPASQASYGRQAEREADMYGMHYMIKAGYSPWGMVEMQKKFLLLDKNKKGKKASGWLASHPATEERLYHATQYAKKWDQGLGSLGFDEYQAQMCRLLGSSEAYEAMNEGYRAFGNKQYDQALKNAEKALAQSPDEPHFYALLGRSYLAKKQYGLAEEALTQAIALNPDYFKYYYFRGVAKKAQGNNKSAGKDFAISYELFPTADTKSKIAT